MDLDTPPVEWATQDQYDEILRLKRGITPGGIDFTEAEIKDLIRIQESFEPDCLTKEAALELLDDLRERYAITRNGAESHEDG